MNISLKSLVFSFIQSVDIFNFILKKHHRRVVVIAWHIGMAYGLNEEQMSRLILAASLHDIGAVSVEERDRLINMDVVNPHPHARLGSYILDSFPPFHELSNIVYYHHWPYVDDDKFIPNVGKVPIEAYIIHLADRIDITIDQSKPITIQVDLVKHAIMTRKNSLFHPKVCDAFLEVSYKNRFWMDIDNKSMREVLDEINHPNLELELDLNLLEQFAYTVSKIIDCRSKFTAAHSFGVSETAYIIAKLANKDETTCRKLRVAGLLHDIGKIGIDVSILEKTGKLTTAERTLMETHAYYTSLILSKSDAFSEIADWASHHHENHDGGGYPDNISKKSITEEMDILAYADIFTALTENRPYRDALPLAKILTIINRKYVVKHGQLVANIINENSKEIYTVCANAIRDGLTRYETFYNLAEIYQNNPIVDS
jgi:HD-GYP domain-containing protein (c-di-GMP phosphodiesterase class II)